MKRLRWAPQTQPIAHGLLQGWDGSTEIGRPLLVMRGQCWVAPPEASAPLLARVVLEMGLLQRAPGAALRFRGLLSLRYLSTQEPRVSPPAAALECSPTFFAGACNSSSVRFEQVPLALPMGGAVEGVLDLDTAWSLVPPAPSLDI